MDHAATALEKDPQLFEALHQWLHDHKPDWWVQRRQYFLNHGRALNVKNPQTFNEKIHWLMRHDRRSVLTQCADKLAVREYVRGRLGALYSPRLLGAWENPADINFDALPKSYVLKTTHGCAQNILVPDADELDRERTQRQLADWLRRGNYWQWREWAYKHIPPRVIAEEWLGEGQTSPPDYKFFCFNGAPMMIQIDTDRHTQHCRAFRTTEWTALPFTVTYPLPSEPSPRPEHLDEMLVVAQTLAVGHPFVRVDLYDLPTRVVFGEMTWYPGGASERFTPESWDTTVGSWLTLPAVWNRWAATGGRERNGLYKYNACRPSR